MATLIVKNYGEIDNLERPLVREELEFRQAAYDALEITSIRRERDSYLQTAIKLHVLLANRGVPMLDIILEMAEVKP